MHFGIRQEQNTWAGYWLGRCAGDHLDLGVLETIAQVATAFAGFTGLITFFQRRERDSWRRVDRTRFWFMIELSLAVLFLSFVPAVGRALSSSAEVPWTFSCGLLFSCVVAQAIAMGLRTSRLTVEERGAGSTLTIALMAAGFVASIAVVGLATIGIGLRASLGPYLIGLLWLLAAATYQFVRIVAAGEPPVRG